MKKQTTQPTIVIVDEDLNYEIKEPGKYIFEVVKEKTNLYVFSALQSKGDKTVELDVLIHHQVPNTTAQTTLKAVAYDQSTLVMKAKILIDPGCHQTESFLTERALLISKDAHALAIPDLEILTDDVKCSHAASVTKIPEEQIFYLTSRGISKRKAEEMIVEGFLKIKE